MVISMARKSLDPQTIFHEEVTNHWKLWVSYNICPYLKAEESLETVRIAVRNFKEFKACFQESRDNLHTYFSEGDNYTPWDFRVINLVLSVHNKNIICFISRMH